MTTALIISIAVAVIFLVLYTEERNSLADLRKEIKEQQKPLRPAGGIDDQDAGKLTPELVADAVKYNGYVPIPDGNSVDLMIQGERYSIWTDRLPYCMVTLSFTIDPERYDIDLLRRAAFMVTDGMYLGKASISPDGTALNFSAESFEPAYGHFRDSLTSYLDILNEARRRLSDVYESLQKEQKDQEEQKGLDQLEALGLQGAETKAGESKILS